MQDSWCRVSGVGHEREDITYSFCESGDGACPEVLGERLACNAQARESYREVEPFF